MCNVPIIAYMLGRAIAKDTSRLTRNELFNNWGSRFSIIYQVFQLFQL